MMQILGVNTTKCFSLLRRIARIQFMFFVHAIRQASRASLARVESFKHVSVLRALICAADAQSTTHQNLENSQSGF